MTTFLLVRHAHCDSVRRRLAGRAAGVHLSAAGRAEAERLAARLSSVPLDAIVSSPLERARETAEAIAADRGVEAQVSAALTELDFGAWTGAEIELLAPDPLWQRFNQFRGTTRPPGGELMLEAQSRAVAELERLGATFPDGRVVVVSHLDVLRAVLCHYLGIPLDHFLRLELAPASVSTLEMTRGGPRLVELNAGGRAD
ncbi:MAG TPA: histidine phosphatase family protein [Gemmatimonadales bacterium]|nr:histidine phosphatase family protein [Gemmatimonadales bacterium]